MIVNNNIKKDEPLLPPSELLKRYDEVYKGLTKELVELVKKEQEQRHRIQNFYLWHFRLGQVCGVAFLFYIFKNIFDLINNGNLNVAYILIGIFTLIFFFSIYQYKKSRVQNQNIRKFPPRNFNRNNNNYRR
jgi:uncharacterized membrane protein